METRRTHWMQDATHTKTYRWPTTLLLSGTSYSIATRMQAKACHICEWCTYVCKNFASNLSTDGQQSRVRNVCSYMWCDLFHRSTGESMHKSTEEAGEDERGFVGRLGWVNQSFLEMACLYAPHMCCLYEWLSDKKSTRRNVSSCCRVSCISICVHRIYDDQMRRRHSAFVRALCQINEFLYKSHKYISILDVRCSCGFVRAMISASLAARARWRPREREKVCLCALYI